MNARTRTRFNVRRSARCGFTLIEALVATSITAVAGSALLLGLSNTMNTTHMALELTVGEGMAQQLMDEIAGKRYCSDPSQPYATTLGPSAYELAGSDRERFDELGDYNGYVAQPAVDRWNRKLGTEDVAGTARDSALQMPNYFDRWRQEVEVYYVRDDDQSVRLADGQTSNFRAVEVRILYNDPTVGLQRITALRRVFAYVPTT